MTYRPLKACYVHEGLGDALLSILYCLTTHNHIRICTCVKDNPNSLRTGEILHDVYTNVVRYFFNTDFSSSHSSEWNRKELLEQETRAKEWIKSKPNRAIDLLKPEIKDRLRKSNNIVYSFIDGKTDNIKRLFRNGG